MNRAFIEDESVFMPSGVERYTKMWQNSTKKSTCP